MSNDYVEHALEREERAWRLLQWGSPAELAPFDEVLAMQGFYTRIQRERSDKALDAFDQELREPPGLSELDAFRIWKPEGCSPRTTTTHQREPQMDSTANASSNSDRNREQLEEAFQPTWHKALNSLRSHAAAVVKTWELAANRNQRCGLKPMSLGLEGRSPRRRFRTS